MVTHWLITGTNHFLVTVTHRIKATMRFSVHCHFSSWTWNRQIIIKSCIYISLQSHYENKAEMYLVFYHQEQTTWANAHLSWWQELHQLASYFLSTEERAPWYWGKGTHAMFCHWLPQHKDGQKRNWLVLWHFLNPYLFWVLLRIIYILYFYVFEYLVILKPCTYICLYDSFKIIPNYVGYNTKLHIYKIINDICYMFIKSFVVINIHIYTHVHISKFTTYWFDIVFRFWTSH